MFDSNEIGENIKVFAEENKTDVSKLAAIVGAESSVIYKWYRNDAFPSVKHIAKIADYFKVSIDYIIGRELEKRTFHINTIPPFCERLSFVMKNSGKSKSAIYKETTISRSQFHYWLKDKRRPTLDSLIKLADCFGVTVDYVIGREN